MMVCRTFAYVLVFLTVSNLFGQEYEIHLTRANKVGDKCKMEAVSSHSSQVTISGQGQLQKNDSSQMATLEGIKTVLEVDGSGKATKLSVIVSKFSVVKDGKANEQEVVAKGSQVVAQWKQDEVVFFVNGMKASKDIAVILFEFFPSPATLATDDVIFGTNERKKVGDTWPVNSIKAATDLSSYIMIPNVSSENIKGTTKLEKIVEIDGIQSLRIIANIEIIGIAGLLPTGTALEKATTASAIRTFVGDFPIDLTIGVLSQETLVTVSGEAKRKTSLGAPESTTSVRMTASQKEKCKPLTPALK